MDRTVRCALGLATQGFSVDTLFLLVSKRPHKVAQGFQQASINMRLVKGSTF